MRINVGRTGNTHYTVVLLHWLLPIKYRIEIKRVCWRFQIFFKVVILKNVYLHYDKKKDNMKSSS